MSRYRAKRDVSVTVSANSQSLPPRFPRSGSPQGQPRMRAGSPPEAYRPFLDALAELLAAEVVRRITAGLGTRDPRKLEGVEGVGFNNDSSRVQGDAKGNSNGR